MRLFSVLAVVVGAATAARDGYGYMDDWVCTSAACFVPYLKSVVTTGLNNVVLGFAMPVGSTEVSSWYWDSTGAFYALTDAQRADVNAHYAANNAHLWMSIGGGTYNAVTYLSQDPEAIARLACTRAKNQGYYGVDFDLEEVFQSNWNAFLPWAITASQTCAGIIGHIAHAPQVPYLGAWLNYGYENLIPYTELMLVQYYNQGKPYNSEAGVWAASNDGNKETWTDYTQRNAGYKNVVVIGKYIRSIDGGSGLVSASEFDALLKIGEDKYGYNNGYMIWKIPMAADTADLNAFINTHIPLLASGVGSTPQTTTTTTPTTTTTTTPSITIDDATATLYVPPPPATTTLYVPPPPPATSSSSSSTTTTTTTTTTTPGGVPSDKIVYCQNNIGHPTPDWNANCKELCVYYGTNPAWCPGANTGEALLSCVLQLHSSSCQRV